LNHEKDALSRENQALSIPIEKDNEPLAVAAHTG